ncbi:MAG: peptidylprolyl isomerase [Cellulomonadaceae bacterium]|nr:peptidylprolyl isomerase [Cellulomonadaceae bacterium]
MSQSKRERDQAAKRQARYEANMAAKRLKQRRLYGIIAGALVLALVLGGVLVSALSHGPSDDAAPADSATENAAEATPSPDDPATSLEEDAEPEDVPQGNAPDPSIAENRSWTAAMNLNVGTVDLTLFGDKAPQAVASFVTLAQDGFFDGVVCHRLTTSGIYVLQCGDPTGTGTGGPGYTFGPIENAPSNDVYPAGTLAMARQGGNANSMGSQFFLVYQDSTIPSDAAGGYTVFGEITSGLNVVEDVANAGVDGGGPDGPPATAVTIEGVDVQ